MIEVQNFFKANAAVLCTGAGGFKPNGFPICDRTHDGSVMAYRIGAKITGKEWNDGHGGNLEHPASVYDQWKGVLEQKPSVVDIGIRHDLGVEQNYEAYTQGPSHEPSNHPPGMGMTGEHDGGPVRPKGLETKGPPRGLAGKGHQKNGHRPPPGFVHS